MHSLSSSCVPVFNLQRFLSFAPLAPPAPPPGGARIFYVCPPCHPCPPARGGKTVSAPPEVRVTRPRLRFAWYMFIMHAAALPRRSKLAL